MKGEDGSLSDVAERSYRWIFQPNRINKQVSYLSHADIESPADDEVPPPPEETGPFGLFDTPEQKLRVKRESSLTASLGQRDSRSSLLSSPPLSSPQLAHGSGKSMKKRLSNQEKLLASSQSNRSLNRFPTGSSSKLTRQTSIKPAHDETNAGTAGTIAGTTEKELPTQTKSTSVEDSPYMWDYARTVREELDFLYEFRDREKLAEFCSTFDELWSDQRPVFLVLLLILFVFILIPMCALQVYRDSSEEWTDMSLLRLATSVGTTLSSVCVSLLSGSLLRRERQRRLQTHVKYDDDDFSLSHNEDEFAFHGDSHNTQQSTLSQPTFHRFCARKHVVHSYNAYLILAIQVTLLFAFLRAVFVVHCAGTVHTLAHRVQGLHCVESSSVSHSATTVLVIPVLFFAAMPETPVFWVWLSQCVAVLLMLCACVLKRDYLSLLGVVVWMIPLSFVVRQIQLRSVMIFCKHKRLGEIMALQEKFTQESHAEEMRHLIANVAHDLKTPLASFTTGLDFIQISVNDLLSLPSLGETPSLQSALCGVEQCVSNIRSTTAFMLMTINRCIDYTKASQGLALRPRPETLSLRDALQLPLLVMQNVQSRVSISLAPLPPSVCSHVVTDKQWLQENLLCLLSNAVKYSEHGTVRVAVSLSLGETPDQELDLSGRPEAEPDLLGYSPGTTMKAGPNRSSSSSREMLCFEVEDAGIGMSDEAMRSLFRPFRQNQRLAGGTGLGLFSLAKRVEALKGRYGVQRRRDAAQGSLFWFAVPYRPDRVAELTDQSGPFPAPVSVCVSLSQSEREESAFALQRESSSLSASTAPLRILLVDDSAPILKMTAMMLRRLGHAVDQAENGAVALRRITEKLSSSSSSANAASASDRESDKERERERAYDVVLMDLQMPVMDGLEAVQRLRAMEKERNREREGDTARQLVIGVSANSDSDTVDAAYAAGIDGFLPKPFDAAALGHTLREFFPQ